MPNEILRPIAPATVPKENRAALGSLSINAPLNSAGSLSAGPIKGQTKLTPLEIMANPLTTSMPKTGTKRPAPELLSKGMTEDEAEDAVENMPIDKSCNQVRTQIRNFIENGGMKIGEFQKAIGVSSKSYLTFMGKNGPYGGESTATYGNAWAFFKKRELMGLAMPKKAKVAPPAASSVPATASVEKATAKNASTAVLTASQLAHVKLDGEDSDSVPIYDDCDDLRRKITSYLSQPGTTAAQLCRDIAAMFKLEPGKKIQSKVLTDFRNKKGALDGNTSSVCYGGYVYFEKVRIHEGKPKTAKRQKNEKDYADEGGLSRERQGRGWYFAGPALDYYSSST